MVMYVDFDDVPPSELRTAQSSHSSSLTDFSKTTTVSIFSALTRLATCDGWQQKLQNTT
jgi:hypothetical protein